MEEPPVLMRSAALAGENRFGKARLEAAPRKVRRGDCRSAAVETRKASPAGCPAGAAVLKSVISIWSVDADQRPALCRKGSEVRLNLVAERFIAARQLERFAQMRGILVAVETGLIGGDLEQDAARSAEIDRPEIIAIDDGGDLIARIHQRLTHVQLLLTVFDGESDMVDRTCPRTGKGRLRQGRKIDRVGTVAAGNDEARHIAFSISAFITHETKKFLSRGRVVQIEARAGEAPYGAVFGNTLGQPGGAGIIVRFDQRKSIAIGTGEAQAPGAEDRVGLKAGGALGKQALFPEAQRTLRDGKLCLAHLTDAGTAGHHVGEGKIGHDRAGRAIFVAVIKVIDAGFVKVDGFLHPAQAERIGEEAVVLPRIRRH
ncbi:hypothetical protein L1887_57675 [Cichorium endivia]|nr:hypothetical protein L1887_57675 [Cichorium endivia]